MKKVMVIAAHADDEVLGCGGTLAKHMRQGDKLALVVMTDGVGARLTSTEQDKNSRGSAVAQVCDFLGISDFYQFQFPDNQMDSVPLLNITQALERAIAEFKPDIIYTHHHGDLNIDHRITHNAVMTACRPQPGFSVKQILTFEVRSSTEWNSPTPQNAFMPNYFVDISTVFDEKLSLLDFYHQELRNAPHSRSIQGIVVQASERGTSIGVEKAEAFMLMRMIN